MIVDILNWIQAPGQWNDAALIIGLFFVAGLFAMRGIK